MVFEFICLMKIIICNERERNVAALAVLVDYCCWFPSLLLVEDKDKGRTGFSV